MMRARFWLCAVLLCAGCETGVPPAYDMIMMTGGLPDSVEGEAVSEGESEGAPEKPAFDTVKAARKFAENAATLRDLSWNERITYRLPGSFTIELLLRVASDANGDAYVTEINRATSEAQGVHRAADARAATEDDQRRARLLADLARAYTSPPPGKMDGMFAAGPVPAAGPGYGLVWFSAADFIMPGDALSLSVNELTAKPERLEITAQAEGTPVEAIAAYRELPDGTFYPQSTEVRLPELGIQLTAERYNFRLQPHR
ncbi:MAG: hypothetical protein GC168_17270 [Candidatus Hydrogenedens sp.]|nr:hypothetical protein [Candidatus Hydrogenedens sp.]